MDEDEVFKERILNFSRLEYREILRCIQGTDCDPDVVAKVRAAIRGDASTPAASIVPPNAPPEARPQSSQTGESWKMVWEPWMGQTDPRTGKPFFTPEEVDIVNHERAVNLAAGESMKRGIPYTLRAPPEIPAGHGIVHTEIGKKNRVGDVCVALREPISGQVFKDVNLFLASDVPLEETFSIIECRKGEHGYYADENPARAGCPTCLLGGGGEVEPEQPTAIRVGGRYQDEESF